MLLWSAPDDFIKHLFRPTYRGINLLTRPVMGEKQAYDAYFIRGILWLGCHGSDANAIR